MSASATNPPARIRPVTRIGLHNSLLLSALFPVLLNAAVIDSFEFRAVSQDARADGITDFKGPTEVMTTDGRVAFLRAYTDHAAAFFDAPSLDRPAVEPAEIHNFLDHLKPQPLPVVRTDIRLDSGWLQAASTQPEHDARPRPWRDLPGAVIREGEMELPPGDAGILDLARSSGWRSEVRWEARSPALETPRWMVGPQEIPPISATPDAGWHSFRLQIDPRAHRAWLRRDDAEPVEFAITRPPTGPLPLQFSHRTPLVIRNLVFIDCIDRRELPGNNRDVVPAGGTGAKSQADRQPYEPVVLADDDFRTPPDLHDWSAPDCDPRGWRPARLPCVHGGFREAGETLHLRRAVDIPAADHVLLDVETLDPSGEIHINGALAAVVADRRPVTLDITRFVRPGRNWIACKVDPNRIDDLVAHAMLDRNCGWFAGRMTLHLLHGPVRLGAPRVRTLELDPGGAALLGQRVLGENTGNHPFRGSLETECRPWFPQEGAVAATHAEPVTIAPGASCEVEIRLPLAHAVPWRPGAPHLYQLHTRLLAADGRPADDVVTTCGVRTVAQAGGRLLVNGRPELLLGAQNMGMRPFPEIENSSKFNRCATPEMLARELLAVKNMGGNLLRVHIHISNNRTGGVNDPRIAEMADQLGLALFWQTPCWVREGDERTVDTEHVGEYIRQVFNHPSILNWELGNHPNRFKSGEGTARTDDYVRRTVSAIRAADDSRLITPTTFWEHVQYGNDLGTVDWKGRPIRAVPEYTDPLVTRGSQDAVTGYGATWDVLRNWPGKRAKDCLDNHTRAWFNFEQEESAGQPNHDLSRGFPWFRLRSYEAPYELGSIGRVLDCDDWRASQGWQAFSAYESMKKQILGGVAGFSWCTIEGGANGGTYEKPLTDPLGNAKLCWYIHRLLGAPVLAGSTDVDTVYGPHDTVEPFLFHCGPACTADLVVSVRSPGGPVLDTRRFPGVRLPQGRECVRLPAFRPKLPEAGHVVVEYRTTVHPE